MGTSLELLMFEVGTSFRYISYHRHQGHILCDFRRLVSELDFLGRICFPQERRFDQAFPSLA